MAIANPENVLFSTEFNYQKIFDNGSETISVGTTSAGPPISYSGSKTVVHGLGYVPTARVFYEPVAGQVWPISPHQYANTDGGPGTTLRVFGRFYVTTNELVVELANLSGSTQNVPIHWRIYLDE